MTSTKAIISGDINAQVLGLSDEHIHYFNKSSSTSPLPINPVGINLAMLTDFNALVKSAAADDIEIKIASGYRNFDRQLYIWNNKFTGKSPIKDINGKTVDISILSKTEIMHAILLFSALPGTSRHHWGCDIDIYAPNLLTGQSLQLEPWEYDSTGPMAKLSTWLAENARNFSFYFPYDRFRGGVAAEPWHLSYVPVAREYKNALTIDMLKSKLLTTNIKGKAEVIKNLPIIFTRYINNVNEFI